MSARLVQLGRRLGPNTRAVGMGFLFATLIAAAAAEEERRIREEVTQPWEATPSSPSPSPSPSATSAQ